MLHGARLIVVPPIPNGFHPPTKLTRWACSRSLSRTVLPGGNLEACLLCHGAYPMEQPPIDKPGPAGLQENSEDLALPPGHWGQDVDKPGTVWSVDACKFYQDLSIVYCLF